MDFEVLGDLDGGPKVSLDHDAFSYAGKFMMTTTGKTVVRSSNEIVGGATFSRDRTDDSIAWIRYVTVKHTRRRNGVGPAILDYTAEELLETVETVRMAVNNPFAYFASYKAEFGFTGETTGLVELVVERPASSDTDRYYRGLEYLQDQDHLSDVEQYFVSDKLQEDPPTPITIDYS